MSMTAMMITTLAELRPDHHPAGGGGAAGAGSSMVGAIFGVVFGLIGMALGLVLIASMWKIFAKAGEAGWMALIPILNIIILLKITRKPVWWIVLYCIPLVNLFAAVMVSIELAKVFGQSTGFAIGLLLLPIIFFPILAFGDSRYSPAYG